MLMTACYAGLRYDTGYEIRIIDYDTFEQRAPSPPPDQPQRGQAANVYKARQWRGKSAAVWENPSL